MSWFILKDGHMKEGPFNTYQDGWMRMHLIQGQSVHHATTYEGWSIEEVGEPEMRDDERKRMNYTITARIAQIARKTTGYGKDEKTVGILITADYEFEYETAEGLTETAKSDIKLSLPLEFRRSYAVGDPVTFTIDAEE